MYIDFYTPHIEILRDLQNLADKHNHRINFGFYDDSSPEIDEELLQDKGFNIEELLKLDLTEKHYIVSSVWFELKEKGKDLYHRLTYTTRTTSFQFNKSSWDELSDEFIEFLEEEDEYGIGFIEKRDSVTIVNGFGLAEEERSGLVYRSGMALKFFSDYVCDYLGEERIVRTY